jgi:hypothetical protein
LFKDDEGFVHYKLINLNEMSPKSKKDLDIVEINAKFSDFK